MHDLIALITTEHLLERPVADLATWKRSKSNLPFVAGSWTVYPQSVYRRDAQLFLIARRGTTKQLVVIAREAPAPPAAGAQPPNSAQSPNSAAPRSAPAAGGLTGETTTVDGHHLLIAGRTPENARALHRLFPWTAPVSLRERTTTIGMGDRLGRATAGHLRAARQYDCSPVLAQQSVRELEFTGRTFADVIADATWLVFQEGFERGYGADGDHLKNIPWIDTALAEGFPMITLDLTDVMRPDVADWSDDEVDAAFADVADPFRRRVTERFVDATFDLPSGPVVIDGATARRCAVMYGPALDFAGEVDAFLREKRGDQYDLEISIDETTTPTLPEHHLFIAAELQERGVTVNSVAPRFVGEFQKAVDYQGDIHEFTAQFRVHSEIAKAFGGYKVSVHSGSDKLSVYPIVGRETDLRLHLKTSGTSWLEALRLVAQEAPDTYRRIHDFAVSFYPEALKSYHITADLNRIPEQASMEDKLLPSYLDHPDARQMLHIAYGGILSHPILAGELFAVLDAAEDRYAELLRRHFERHLDALGVPKLPPTSD